MSNPIVNEPGASPPKYSNQNRRCTCTPLVTSKILFLNSSQNLSTIPGSDSIECTGFQFSNVIHPSGSTALSTWDYFIITLVGLGSFGEISFLRKASLVFLYRKVVSAVKKGLMENLLENTRIANKVMIQFLFFLLNHIHYSIMYCITMISHVGI